MFCLLVVLVKLSLLAKWLSRKTPLKTPLNSKEIISTKARPKTISLFRFSVLFYCVFVLSPSPVWLSGNSSHHAVRCKPEQGFHIHMPLSPGSIIGTGQWAVMLTGWEVSCGPGREYSEPSSVFMVSVMWADCSETGSAVEWPLLSVWVHEYLFLFLNRSSSHLIIGMLQ